MADVYPVRGIDDATLQGKMINVSLVGGAVATAVQVGVGTDRSIVASVTSQTLLPASAARRRFYVKNDTAIDVWINPGAAATAAAGAGNIKVPANGGYFEFGFSSSAWQIIASSGTPAITAREF